jgi:hypothetical protein
MSAVNPPSDQPERKNRSGPVGIHRELPAERGGELFGLDGAAIPALDVNVQAAPRVERVRLVGHLGRGPIAAGDLSVLLMNSPAALVIKEQRVLLGGRIARRHVNPDDLDPLHRPRPVRKGESLSGITLMRFTTGQQVFQQVPQVIHCRPLPPIKVGGAQQELNMFFDLREVWLNPWRLGIEPLEQFTARLCRRPPFCALVCPGQPGSRGAGQRGRCGQVRGRGGVRRGISRKKQDHDEKDVVGVHA